MEINTKANGHQASIQTSWSISGVPHFKKKQVIMKYGLKIRNHGYFEHAINIGTSTEKTKDCL